MTLRSVLYWVISIGTLLICLWYPYQTSQSQNNPDPLSLTSYLDVEPRYLYYADNKFHARVVGALRIDLKIADMKSDITQFNTLVLEDFDYVLDSQYSLNWTIGDDQHQVMINKSNQSVSVFDFKTTDPSLISEAYILMEANTEMGTELNMQQLASFKALYFDVLENHNIMAVHSSEWFDFTPIKFNSINGYTSGQDPHLKQLILRLACWVLLSTVAFLFIRVNGKHLIWTLTAAWTITAIFYANNHIKQHQQAQVAFTPKQSLLNPLDQLAIKTAESIKTMLKEAQISSEVTNKLVLIGPNEFFSLRLIHHLLEYNVGLTVNFERLFSSSGTQYVYILIEHSHHFCSKKDQYPWLANQAEIIAATEQFCIMRRK